MAETTIATRAYKAELPNDHTLVVINNGHVVITPADRVVAGDLLLSGPRVNYQEAWRMGIIAELKPVIRATPGVE